MDSHGGDDDASSSPLVDLPEDLILEIMYYLPMKKAAQCRCLNKGFNELIGNPRFVLERAVRSREKTLLHYSIKSFDKLSLYPPHSNDYSDIGEKFFQTSVSLSSTGRILIRFSDESHFVYLFNPLLGAYRIIPIPPAYSCSIYGGKGFQLGLVDKVDFSSSSFTLVAAVKNKEGLKFFVFESEKSGGRGKWLEAYAGPMPSSLGSLNSRFVTNSEPVHLNQRVHWLLENGNLLVFDLTRQLPRIIPMPPLADLISDGGEKESWIRSHTWLGTVGGYLAYAVPKGEEIVIYGFDDREEVWKKKCVIENIPNPYQNGRPVLWDGEILVVENFRKFYMYEVAGKKWKRIGQLQFWADGVRSYHRFVSTFAAVPGCKYLHDDEHQSSSILYNAQRKINIVKRLADLRLLLITAR